MIASAALFLLLPGCYPEQPQYVEEYDVAYTNYAPDFNFNNTYTYSLPEGVLLLDDSRGPEDAPEFIDPKFGDVILELEELDRNLARLCYNRYVVMSGQYLHP